MSTSPVVAARARVARTCRKYGTDHPASDAARADYRAEKLAAVIREIVDQSPPLDDAQKNRLAALLRPNPQHIPDAAARIAETMDGLANAEGRVATQRQTGGAA